MVDNLYIMIVYYQLCVVIRIQSESYISHFVRLFFDKEVIEYVRENDILDIRIVKINNRWRLDEIKGCSISIEMTW